MINDATEYNVTKQMLLTYIAKGVTENFIWIDGTDQVVEGRWMCESIDAPCPYLPWHTTQPNVGGEHCIDIYAHYDGLIDHECANENLAICEFEC